MNRLFRTLARLLRDEEGQDLLEYAMLTACVGLAGAAAMTLVMSAIDSTYSSWDTGVNGIWQSPNP